MDLKNFTSAMAQIAEEKGISAEKVMEIIEVAIAAAYKKDYGEKGQIIKAKINPKTGEAEFWQIKLVVDEDMVFSEEEVEKMKEEAEKKEDETQKANEAEKEAAIKKTEEVEIKNKADEAQEIEGTEEDETIKKLEEDEAEAEEEKEKKIYFNSEKHIMLDEAKKVNSEIEAGEELKIDLEIKEGYGRVAAQTAKQVIIQSIREAEKENAFAEYKNKEGEVISGIVQRVENKNVFLDIGKILGFLSKEEQGVGEFYRTGQRIKVYVLKVEEGARGPSVVLSRAYPKLVSALFELEVPEISTGQIEIKSIAREAGSRTKVSVLATQEGIDPIGSMVGQRGTRVTAVINELGGEKIDIIEYSDEPEEYIANSLLPAKIIKVEILEKNRALVTVAEDQLSLAIGKGGQNVRLAAKLTGWKIDVRDEKGKTEESLPDEAIMSEENDDKGLKEKNKKVSIENSEEKEITKKVADGAEEIITEKTEK